MRNPVVYVPQDIDRSTVNLLPAKEYGELIPCFVKNQLIHNVFQCYRDIKKSMGSAQKGDYLLCVGDPAVIALCAVFLHKKTGGNYRILKWDKQTKKYYSVVIDIGEEDE